MGATAYWYSLGLQDSLRAISGSTVILNGGTFGAALLTGDYPFNQDTDHFLTTAMAYEITGTGYTSLGATVNAATISYDTASNEIRWDCSDPTWTGSSFSAQKMAIYYRLSGGTTTTWPLVIFVDFGGTYTVSSGTFTYQVAATGAGYIQTL